MFLFIVVAYDLVQTRMSNFASMKLAFSFFFISFLKVFYSIFFNLLYEITLKDKYKITWSMFCQNVPSSITSCIVVVISSVKRSAFKIKT